MNKDTLSRNKKRRHQQSVFPLENVDAALDMEDEIYVPTKYKLLLSLLFSTIWCTFSIYVALPWIAALSESIGSILAYLVIAGIALIPGFTNAFLVSGLLLDRRPDFSTEIELPGVSILIAAYNESACILQTLESINKQVYSAPIQIIVIDDGSTDETVKIASDYFSCVSAANFSAEVIVQPKNAGKANALNTGLTRVLYEHVITLDADCYLFRDALANIVKNLVLGPANTAAVAGTVLVRNSRKNWITKLQEWDYYQGISVVKRIQSLYQGTLVAQGAFSIYKTDALKTVGGWPDTLGEDIVLTWSFLEAGLRVSYAENAFVFTDVPDNYNAYYRQRKRWSRGLIEAFKRHPKLLIKPRMNLPFIYFNVLFPYMDAAYLFGFVPGVILAVFFDNYAIVGIMTLFLLPLAMLINFLMYIKQGAIFKNYGLKVRRNILGLICYMLFYQLLLSPASLMGYLYECINIRKEW